MFIIIIVKEKFPDLYGRVGIYDSSKLDCVEIGDATRT